MRIEKFFPQTQPLDLLAFTGEQANGRPFFKLIFGLFYGDNLIMVGRKTLFFRLIFSPHFL